jgi:heme o synthase
MAESKIREVKVFGWLHDRSQLIKLPISLMSAVAALFGYIAHSRTLSANSIIAAAGVFCLACGASALNSYQDRHLDGLMERTRLRPLPAGRISPIEAILTSFITIAAGAAVILLSADSFFPLLAGLSAIILYNVLYTPLKKKTQIALVPGVLSGMLPPLVGWLAAGGGDSPLICYLMIFFGTWQVPHFWLIYLSYRNDFRLMRVPIILDSISKHGLIKLLLLWSLAYGILLLFMRPFNIVRCNISSIILLINAPAVPLIFLIILYIVKGDKKFRYLFHYLNISTAGVICMAIIDSLLTATGHI